MSKRMKNITRVRTGTSVTNARAMFAYGTGYRQNAEAIANHIPKIEWRIAKAIELGNWDRVHQLGVLLSELNTKLTRLSKGKRIIESVRHNRTR